MFASVSRQAVAMAAPAKINLYLHVTGRRADGYHELDSLVMFASVGDALTVTETPGGGRPTLTLDGPFAGVLKDEAPESNLVIRAVNALADHLGRAPEVAVTLTKGLPVASGIGGGSADAAACLRALATLWSVPLNDPALIGLAAGLGADVPVCLTSCAAYFGGIGERLDAAPLLPACPALLVNPGVAVPTPAVFRARTGPFSAAARLDRPPESVQALAAVLAARRNDLTEAAIAVASEIAAVLAALDASRDVLLSRLSGSGATCFALYPDDQAAAFAGAALSAAHPEWWVRACRLA